MYSQKNDLNTLLRGCKLTIIPFSEKIFFALILGFKDLILNTFNRLLEQTLINVASKNCIYCKNITLPSSDKINFNINVLRASFLRNQYRLPKVNLYQKHFPFRFSPFFRMLLFLIL